MLVSKNPYVVEARQKLSPKKPYLAPKTGEKSSQNTRLKSLFLSSKNKERSYYLAFQVKTQTEYEQTAFALAMHEEE